MQLKITTGYQLTRTRMAVIQERHSQVSARVWRKWHTTHPWWEGAMLQPLWKIAEHRLQCDPEILLLGLCPFLGSNITEDGDCSHEITRHLLLGRKVMTNLDCILKSRDVTLPTKVCLVKAMVFPVVMYGCESWTIKKAERQRTDAFELWC